jgi:hypothetical protein
MNRRRGMWAGGRYVLIPDVRRHAPTRDVPGGWEDAPYLRVERAPEPPKPDPGRCAECLHYDGQHQSWCSDWKPRPARALTTSEMIDLGIGVPAPATVERRESALPAMVERLTAERGASAAPDEVVIVATRGTERRLLRTQAEADAWLREPRMAPVAKVYIGEGA